jgi:hypothetical protein
MSLLTLRARPIMAFDAGNPKHRQYYYEFMVKRTWGYCPVRFMAEGLNTDLVHHIQHEMLGYYVKQEFKNRKSGTKGSSYTVSKRQSV